MIMGRMAQNTPKFLQRITWLSKPSDKKICYSHALKAEKKRTLIRNRSMRERPSAKIIVFPTRAQTPAHTKFKGILKLDSNLLNTKEENKYNKRKVSFSKNKEVIEFSASISRKTKRSSIRKGTSMR